MHSLKDNNPEVYKIFRRKFIYSMRDNRKWTGLTPDSFSIRTSYNEAP